MTFVFILIHRISIFLCLFISTLLQVLSKNNKLWNENNTYDLGDEQKILTGSFIVVNGNFFVIF